MTPSDGPDSTAGARRKWSIPDRVGLLTLVLSLFIATAVTSVWLHRDSYFDREESGHIIRAFQTLDALQGNQGLRFKARRLFFLRVTEDSKPWYGFPYYAVVATFWQMVRPSYDSAVSLNLLWLALTAAMIVAAIRCFTGEARWPAYAAATVFVLLPGTNVWTHLFSPTLFLVAAVAATEAFLIRSEGLTKQGNAAIAGAVAAIAAITKLTSVFYWLPLLVIVLAQHHERFRSRRTLRGALVFLLAFSVAPAYLWVNRSALQFWDTQLRALWSSPSVWATTVDIARRWNEIAHPSFLLLIAGGATAGLFRSHQRALSMTLLASAALSAITIAAVSGQSGSSRDHLPAFVLVAIALGAGLDALGPRWLMILAPVVTTIGALVLSLNQLRDPSTARSAGLLERVLRTQLPSGATRMTPFPDLVAAVISDLPPPSAFRCSCLGALPYPAAGERDKPVLALDSFFVGPENLEADARFSGKKLPWKVGLVPYPLPCSAFHVAMSCVTAVVVEDKFGAGYPTSGDVVRERRPELERWGRLTSVRRIAGITHSVRVNTTPSVCDLRPAPVRMAWYARELSGCGKPDYYSDFVRVAVGPPELSTTNILSAIRAAAETRLSNLEQGADAPSTVFGEEFLIRSVFDQLEHRQQLINMSVAR